VEHEVVHDQLAAAVEQLEQADLTLRSLEGVRRGDLDHREATAVGAQLVAGTRHGLLALEQLHARGAPLLARLTMSGSAMAASSPQCTEGPTGAVSGTHR
jgi:hypothetical protein